MPSNVSGNTAQSNHTQLSSVQGEGKRNSIQHMVQVGSRKTHFPFLLHTADRQKCCSPKRDMTPFSPFHPSLGERESSSLSHTPTKGLQRPCNFKIAF